MSEKKMKEIETVDVEETVDVKPYTFRKLSSPDVFPMFKIISLIGVNEFTSCFEKDSMKKLVNNLLSKEGGETDGESIKNLVGVSLTLDIVNIVLSNVPKCESYIYQLLSQTSNLSVDEIKELEFAVFAEMVIDFVKKEEFKDFIKVVSKLFK